MENTYLERAAHHAKTDVVDVIDQLLALNTSHNKKGHLYNSLKFDSSSKISSNYLKDKELLNNLESIKVKKCDPIGNKRIYN